MFTAERVIHTRLKKSMTKCRHNKVESMYSEKKCDYKEKLFLV